MASPEHVSTSSTLNPGLHGEPYFLPRVTAHSIAHPSLFLDCTDITPETSRRCDSSSSSHSAEATDILTPLPRPSSARRTSQYRSKAGPQPSVPSPQPLGISELLASPTIDYDFDYHHSNKHTKAAASYFDLPVRPNSPSEHTLSPRLFSDPSPHSSPPPWTPSDSASSSRSGSGRQPRIRNKDKNLAPHGTFTSAPPMLTINRPHRPHPAEEETPKRFLSPGEIDELLRAARSGDQLALRRLGSDSSRRRRQRHSLGDADNVWGSDTRSVISRSSPSSSRGSTCGIGEEPCLTVPPESPRARPCSRQSSSIDPDLFDDVARMTLQSNARSNTRESASRTASATNTTS